MNLKNQHPIGSPERTLENINHASAAIAAILFAWGKVAFLYAVESYLRRQDTGDADCYACDVYRKAADAVRDAACEASL